MQSQGKTRNTIKEIVNYSKKYRHVLDSGDASQLLGLSPRNRLHTMAALANLSKFTGRYQEFQQIKQSYNLKWTSGNESIKAMERFFNPQCSLDSMLSKVKEMIRVLPVSMGTVIKFNCLTGLRPPEAIESVRLLNRLPVTNYYDTSRCILQHFKFPDIFLRTTKKAYLSYLSSDNYQWIANLGRKTPNPHLDSDTDGM